jgi:DNA-binding NarL/FixJ family response regulator
MIRVLVADDHPAVRSGLVSLLAGMDGIEPAGDASDGYEVLPAIQRTTPDVVLLDHRLPGESGIVLCRKIKRALVAPAVGIYSAFATDQLTIPALVAGADAVLDKGIPANELMSAIHALARGERIIPAVERIDMLAASSLLSPDQLVLLGMIVHGENPAGMASTMRLSTDAVEQEIDRILQTLLVNAEPKQPAPLA